MWSDEYKKELSEKMSNSAKVSAKKYPNRGMSGKNHSPETVEKFRQQTLLKIKNGVFKQTDTYINKIIESILNEIGVEYEKEYIYGHFAFDFKVKNYLIEVHGDYWHWNPKIKKEKPKNKTIIRNLARDKAKEKEVKTKSEFELIYFWEYDINNNLKEVKECLMKLFL